MKFVLHEGKRIEQDVISLLKTFTDPLKTKFTVSVEGNIGCGKSTLLQYFNSSSNVETISEPVDKWCNIRGENALERLYTDPKRWCFSFNLYALLTRVQMHTTPSLKSVKMLERSVHSTMNCFVKQSLQDDTITDLEYSILDEWYKQCSSDAMPKVDLFVYLRASPEICIERIKSRARKEETFIPEKLIMDLHDLHESWLLGPDFCDISVDVQSGESTFNAALARAHSGSGKPGAPVLVLDASYDLPQMRNLWEQERQSILCGYD